MPEVYTIVKDVRPFHPLLGCNGLLDSRSWNYALQPILAPIKPVRHQDAVGILDQGQVGSCTGESALSCSYHEPFYAPGAPSWAFSPDQPGAYAWYARNTREDSYPGTFTYPPTGGDDTGSDTLTSAKVAQEAGIITGYQMAGDLDSSLETLQDRPGQTGIPWYNSMFGAPSSGLLTVDVKSGLAGGHALCVDEIVAADDPRNGTGKMLVGMPNSWGPNFGDHGRCYLTVDDWWMLRQQQGDVYFWMPKSQPAPVPTPPGPPAPVPGAGDADLWAAGENFSKEHHALPEYRRLAAVLRGWGPGKGFSA